MPLIITYHQIEDDEIVGYYDYLDTSFIEEEDAEIKALVQKENKQ